MNTDFNIIKYQIKKERVTQELWPYRYCYLNQVLRQKPYCQRSCQTLGKNSCQPCEGLWRRNWCPSPAVNRLPCFSNSTVYKPCAKIYQTGSWCL